MTVPVVDDHGVGAAVGAAAGAAAGAAPPPGERRHVDVVIIGSGFGGLAALHRLRERGIRDVVVIERSNEVGGTWRDNTYPGAACDVPSHLYSLSFAPNPSWSRTFSPQAEIQDYLIDTADRFGLRPHIRFDTELVSARWDDETRRWCLETSTGPLSANKLVSAAGALVEPTVPAIDGIDGFTGDIFHTSRWRHDVDLTGKRVAVIGTGASAIQVVPAIADTVGSLTVFQRTPPWIVPRTDRAISAGERWLYRHIPVTQRLMRSAIYASREALVPAFLDVRFGRLQETVARRHLARQVPDPELRARLTPTYAVGCKRILLSNDYYPTLAADHVTLIDSALDRVSDGNRLKAVDGRSAEVDVIIFATGFDVQGLPISHRIFDADGRSLWDSIPGDLTAYLGSSFAGFPNFWMVLGPNTGLGHNSQVFMIEAQATMVADLLAEARAAGVAVVEADPDRQRRWSDGVRLSMEGTVWTSGGCSSWYLDDDGMGRALWPGSTVSFWRHARSSVLADYRTTRGGDDGRLKATASTINDRDPVQASKP